MSLFLKSIINILLISLVTMTGYAQQYKSIKGQVLDLKDNKGLPGSVITSSSGIKVSTDLNGYFEIVLSPKDTSFNINTLGYASLLFDAETLIKNQNKLYLTEDSKQIEEVIVSTGYETIQKRNATGSFDVIGEELLQRSAGQNILGRIENLTPGLYFNKSGSSASFSTVGRPAQYDMYLQGISTLRETALGASSPLIILDNFIYEGDINNINPNDILSVTILKDAAAAAIWGAKAGNGVIVIQTKGASKSNKLSIDFQNNIQVYAKPDLYANKIISSAELIDLEMDLYNRGFYQAKYNARTKLSLPPVVELLYGNANGQISDQDLNTAIEAYKTQDVRESMLKHMFRNSILNQHNLRFSGGANNYKYGLSLGYDKSLATRIGDNNNRVSIKVDNAIDLNEKLSLMTALRLNLGKEQRSVGSEYYSDNGYKFPYVSVADEQGNALAIPWDYRTDYINTTGDGKLLDWSFRPLDEARNPVFHLDRNEVIADLNLKYKVLPFLQVTADYRFQNSGSQLDNHYNLEHYYTRNLINRGSQITNSGVVYNFPFGGIFTKSENRGKSHNGRVQLNLSTQLKEKHQIRAIAGFDITNSQTETSGFTMYGYDAERGLFANNVAHNQQYPVYDNLASFTSIGYPISPTTFLVNRTVSAYFNGSYTFDNKHILSSSLRKDASNLFGVETNNKWTPLWSAGYSYLIDNEKFYNIDWLPKLKLRTTYGVSGNVDNSLSSNVTINHSTNGTDWNVNYNGATIISLPNPNLRWEKVRQLNVALDFSLGKTERIRGSIDYYNKYTEDLLYSVRINPTYGKASAVYNVANTKTKGVNVSLTTLNILKPFRWESVLNFGYNNNWIVDAHKEYSGPTRYINGMLSEKKETIVYGLYSYKWGGLDPQTGAPQGIINGEPSTDYAKLTSTQTPFEDLFFHGSSRPLYFGSMMNSVSYKKLSMSFNIIYQFDFYLRRTGLDYADLLNNSRGHLDYNSRWQQPGDEKFTHVPAFTYPLNTAANVFYSKSEPLVEKGDFISLNDIRLDYKSHLNVKNKNLRLTLFGMVNNVGIIWKSSKLDINPQYRGNIAPPSYYSIGININY